MLPRGDPDLLVLPIVPALRRPQEAPILASPVMIAQIVSEPSLVVIRVIIPDPI
jgi:hypothetical protein